MKLHVLGIIVSLAIATPLCAQTHQITDIGLLDSRPTYATSINDNGVVCGYALPNPGLAEAWVFDNFTLAELPGLGGPDTRTMTVAADGRVYGYATDGAGIPHAVCWQNGIVADLGPASGSRTGCHRA